VRDDLIAIGQTYDWWRQGLGTMEDISPEVAQRTKSLGLENK